MSIGKGLQIERRTGEDFYIRDERYEVTGINRIDNCTVKRCSDGHMFILTHESKVEIAPGVNAFVGNRGQLNMVRIVLEGDRSIPIIRGEIWREAGKLN